MFHVPCCMLHSVCCIHPTGGSSVPWNVSFYPLLAGSSRFWVSVRRPWNSLKFQCLHSNPTNHQNGAPRPSKVTKMRSKQVPEFIQISEKPEKWNLMKTMLFTVLLRGWDIRSQQKFQSQITKNRACNPNMLFDVSNHLNCEKVTPKWRQEVTQESSKIVENRSWAIQEPYWVHPCTQWSPKWRHSGALRSQIASKMKRQINKKLELQKKKWKQWMHHGKKKRKMNPAKC